MPTSLKARRCAPVWPVACTEAVVGKNTYKAYVITVVGTVGPIGHAVFVPWKGTGRLRTQMRYCQIIKFK